MIQLKDLHPERPRIVSETLQKTSKGAASHQAPRSMAYTVGKSKRSSKSKVLLDSGKDRAIRTLCQILSEKGLEVRREELKRGPGWRATSGACRILERKVIFLDRRIPQDEQLDFLVERVHRLGIVPRAEELENFPAAVRCLLVPGLSAPEGCLNRPPETAP